MLDKKTNGSERPVILTVAEQKAEVVAASRNRSELDRVNQFRRIDKSTGLIRECRVQLDFVEYSASFHAVQLCQFEYRSKQCVSSKLLHERFPGYFSAVVNCQVYVALRQDAWREPRLASWRFDGSQGFVGPVSCSTRTRVMGAGRDGIFSASSSRKFCEPVKFRVHFSLHFERDFAKFEHISKQLDPRRAEALPFLDQGAWSRLTRAGDDFVARWFEKQIESAHVIVVLIGAQTYTRALIRYELSRAATRQRAMFGVNLCGITNQDGTVETAKGPSPFDYIAADDTKSHPARYPIHDWSDEKGPAAFDKWVVDALRH